MPGSWGGVSAQLPTVAEDPGPELLAACWAASWASMWLSRHTGSETMLMLLRRWPPLPLPLARLLRLACLLPPALPVLPCGALCRACCAKELVSVKSMSLFSEEQGLDRAALGKSSAVLGGSSPLPSEPSRVDPPSS